MLLFEELEVGQRFAGGRHTVDREEIVSFAREWDPQPFHLDDEAARQSVFGEITASTAHIFAILCKLSHQYEARADSMAALGIDEMRMLRPLRPGDTLHLENEVIAMRLSRSKPDRGVVSFQAHLINQEDEVVMSMKATSMVRARST
ncbi:MAG: MaoC family dehydratase [Deltaproteobacteria bacterium]|nr:MaoC family dehydratase [Deltaproteobacteria bacterium]